MKKSKTLLTFTAITTAAMMTGCSYVPKQNIEGDVYGPPTIINPGNGTPKETELITEEETVNVETDMRGNELVYGPPSFDTDANVNVDVYGPPEDF